MDKGAIMQKTGIEYLTHTWNPIAMRCSPESPGCKNCWHLRTADRLCKNPGMPEAERKALAGEGPFILRERELKNLLGMKKPAVIGVQFMGDLFHEDVPDEFIFTIFEIICAGRGRHTFLILTKRPHRMVEWLEKAREYCPTWFTPGGRFDLWGTYFGVTVCNQAEADTKIPELLKVTGKTWISIEPMLGPINLRKYFCGRICEDWGICLGKIKHLCSQSLICACIVGGETGPGARPLHPDWVRGVKDQCKAAGVPFYFKHWGEWAPFEDHPCFANTVKYGDPRTGYWQNNHPGHYQFRHRGVSSHGQHMLRVGSQTAGHVLDGRTWDNLPWGSIRSITRQ